MGEYLNHLQRFPAEFYHKLRCVGILAPEEEVGLFEGLLMNRVERSRRCVSAANRLGVVLRRVVPHDCQVREREDVTFAGAHPESVVRPEWAVVATSGTAVMVAEIYDQLPKVFSADLARVYARAGILAYWNVNLIDRTVEVFTSPTGPIDDPHYSKREVYRLGGSVPLVLDGRTVGTIAVADVMA